MTIIPAQKTETISYEYDNEILSLLSACVAETGTEQWGADMKEKPAGNLSASEVADFAKHCILK